MTDISAFAVIVQGGKVLLCHRRDQDLWNLPGGGAEKGETPWEAVVREVEEETGLEVWPQRLSGVYFKPMQRELSFCFVCEVVGGRLDVSEENDQSEYFALADFPKNTVPKQRERAEDALAGKLEAVFRTQEGMTSDELLRELGKK